MPRECSSSYLERKPESVRLGPKAGRLEKIGDSKNFGEIYLRPLKTTYDWVTVGDSKEGLDNNTELRELFARGFSEWDTG